MTESVEETVAEEVPPGGKFLKRALLYALGVCLLISVIAVYAVYLLYDHVTTPRTSTGTQEFTVPAGASGSTVAELLFEQNLLEHPIFFKIAIKMDETPAPIKHGVYALPTGVSATQLLDTLQNQTPTDALSETHKVTLPEGLTIAQMSGQFENPERFIEAANSLNTYELFGVDVGTPEGFLMPNTYFFSSPPTEQEVVARMGKQFKDDYEGLLLKYPDMRDYDLVKIVTVASLVEEEARADDERSLVAAVIYNRLEKDMALEMDSTLQYALKKYGQRLLNVDKKIDSPYNTYLKKGLPPGPISNPGVKSLEAAMNPGDVEYIFFVSNADGKTHTFSNTLKEHNRAVAQYRKEVREQRKQQEQQ